jgi:hypothetical protein
MSCAFVFRFLRHNDDDVGKMARQSCFGAQDNRQTRDISTCGLDLAEKEATVYIVDMGRSMGERHHGRPMTDLEWAMPSVLSPTTPTVAVFRPVATCNCQFSGVEQGQVTYRGSEFTL